MRFLRFRPDWNAPWTQCSFAGEEEEAAQAVLASRLAPEYDVEISDDESEEWLEVESP